MRLQPGHVWWIAAEIGMLQDRGLGGVHMSDPVFFFSYGRQTSNDEHLNRFYKDLKAELAKLLPAGEETNGFRDDFSIASGDDWNTKIADALQKSQVLVCIYTAKLFDSQYCGREFAAFIKRNKDVWYEQVQEKDGRIQYRIRDSRNIIPILWTSQSDLNRHPHNLPPYLVSSIQYTTPQASLFNKKWLEVYREYGLEKAYRKASQETRRLVAYHFATEIRDACNAVPLQTLPLTFDGLWHAFKDVPKEYRQEDVAIEDRAAVDDREPPEPSRRDLVAIEIASASGESTRWTPRSAEFGAMIDDIAYDLNLRLRRSPIDPGSDDFETKVATIVEQATEKFAIPILFVDPKCFRTAEQRSALERIRQKEWYGGIIIPADDEDKDAIRLVNAHLPSLKETKGEGAGIAVRDGFGVKELRTSIDSVRIYIEGRILDTGSVERKPEQKGRESRPRLSNTG
jgi:hypothetical protein